MPWFLKIFIAIEILGVAYLVVAIVWKLVERIREYKKDKYKKIKY